MGRLVAVCDRSEVGPGQGKHFEVEDRQVAVFNVDGEFHAIAGACTHQGGPLGDGDLDDTEVTCPWHGARFDVTSGAVTGPPAMESVQSYPVVLEDHTVKVELPD